MRRRDPDPLESQVRILFAKSGGRCAYPGCGISLCMPSRARADLPKNIGRIAHITAASPKGPRYDPALTTEQRRGEGNLILLCPSHHDVVDAQLDYHTVSWLQDAKSRHEAAVVRGYDYAMLAVGFKELDLVCDAIVLGAAARADIPADPDDLIPPLAIQEKLRLNQLGGDTRRRIQLGLARQAAVQSYISGVDALLPGFARRLTAQVKGAYLQGVARGLAGDEAFGHVLGVVLANCGPALTEPVEAAAISVVVHFFAICEILDSDHPSRQARLAS